MKSVYLSLFLGLAMFSAPRAARAVAPVEITLPSEAPSGNPVVDRIHFKWYPVVRADGAKSPAVILLHYLGSTGEENFRQFAQLLNSRGIAAAQLTLPYHGKRAIRLAPINYFITGGAKKVAQAFGQSASDVSTVVTWLTQQPSVDSNRIGASGVSLGAIVTHLAMGQDPRISAGVASLGAGNLPNNYRHSLANRYFTKPRVQKYTPAEEELLRGVDPLTFADKNRPRRVLMVQAARDSLLDRRYAQELWEALGRPPIQWIDTNHFALSLAPKSAMKASIAYFETAWGDTPDNISKVPRVRVPTLKAGFLTGLDSTFTPAIQYQFASLGTRNHMALLHANAGLTVRGPFVGVAATINRYLDVGVGRRLLGDKIRPYASYHLAF
jgi:dienelactone hydrolase